MQYYQNKVEKDLVQVGADSVQVEPGLDATEEVEDRVGPTEM